MVGATLVDGWGIVGTKCMVSADMYRRFIVHRLYESMSKLLYISVSE